jgi:hypothetical protein
VKALRWIIILFIPVNLLILLTSFAFPGKLGFADNYQVSIQKMIIHQLDKANLLPVFNREHTNALAANAIQFTDLTPYLDDVQPGTLFFSIQGRRVSKIFIRNEWKHCGIFLGTLQQIEHYWGKEHDLVTCLRAFYTAGDEYLIFDSSYDQGVSVHSISEMAGLDEVSTLKKLLLLEYTCNKEVWSQSIQNNLSHIGKEYDYCFVLDSDDALYCAEFLCKVLPLEKNYFTPSAKIAGRPLLLPSDLVDAILDKGISSGAFAFKGCISKTEGTMNDRSLQ